MEICARALAFVSVLALAGVLFAPGTLGHHWDWLLPSDPAELRRFGWTNGFAWQDFDFGSYVTYHYATTLTGFLFAAPGFVGLGGAFVTKSLLRVEHDPFRDRHALFTSRAHAGRSRRTRWCLRNVRRIVVCARALCVQSDPLGRSKRADRRRAQSDRDRINDPGGRRARPNVARLRARRFPVTCDHRRFRAVFVFTIAIAWVICFCFAGPHGRYFGSRR